MSWCLVMAIGANGLENVPPRLQMNVLSRFFAPKDAASSSISSGPIPVEKEIVCVVGASGNVGKLVVARLLDFGYGVVRGVVRNDESADRLRDWLVVSDRPLPEVKVVSLESKDQLRAAIEDATIIIACTGTTAFPTKAWAGGEIGSRDVSSAVLSTWQKKNFDVEKTIQALSSRGMNTPENVDAVAIERLVECFGKKLRRAILVSSIGVNRRDQFPFTILNAAGVLDAKARGEAAIINSGVTYTIVRPGQLFGEPYDNNNYLGTLFKLDKDSKTRNVVITPGDTVAGDTLRSSLADVVVASIAAPATHDTDFAVINSRGKKPNDLVSLIESSLGQQPQSTSPS